MIYHNGNSHDHNNTCQYSFAYGGPENLLGKQFQGEQD
jgi:hypothetical protein